MSCGVARVGTRRPVFEARPVRGQGNLFQTGRAESARKMFQQLHDISAHKGLSTRDPQFRDASRDKPINQPGQFLKTENVRLR